MAGATGLALPDDHIVHSLYSLEAGQAAATRLLAAGVTAIICASDPIALGAVRAVRRAGLRVPDDVSIVGFDDSALMNCIDPPLTTVRQPIEPMGRMIIELLVSQMTSGANRRQTSYCSSRNSSCGGRRGRFAWPPSAIERKARSGRACGPPDP